MIRIDKISLRYGSALILDDISLSIPRGGITALIGPNGAGKSSLLSLIARLQPLQSGSITVEDLPVDRTSGRDLAKIIAILRQDLAATARLRVRELVGFGRFPHSRGRLTPEDRSIVDRAIQQFGLADLSERFLDTLSGGQRQRAFVAMAFAQETDYLLLDEPLNNLDMYHARALMRSLRAIADQHGKTIVIVLHDINHAASHADRIIALKDGRIAADGAPSEILRPDVLASIFGYEMRVETIDGIPVALHFR
ncbi:ATP-binding cassette domain-containing protein [Rhizobium sp. RU36D]|uniref:iron ABC transporter ATP-binding protein n=1 Tax=Rhizobium sp. RU36D TaxID=1907415 RepID=UPI0009D7ABC0|nr:ATP-binding cassette domain-containing protein [Rhizobium sp. RU36D]SMC95049.1 iron complex transport system ATP-binding protein [Rhizobium sp. RU36D]